MYRLLPLLFILSISLANTKTVAISYFDNTSGTEEYDPLSKGLADMLITDLSNVKSLKIVEREKLESLLKEIELGDGKFIDPNTAQKLGKGLGAGYMLTGSFLIMGEEMRIDARLVDVGTGEVIMAEEITGGKDTFFNLEKDLVDALIISFNIKLSRSEKRKLKKNQTESFEAFNVFSMGLIAYDNGDIDQAINHMDKALVFDSGYDSALDKIENLEKRLEEISSDTKEVLQKVNDVEENLNLGFIKIDNTIKSLIKTIGVGVSNSKYIVSEKLKKSVKPVAIHRFHNNKNDTRLDHESDIGFGWFYDGVEFYAFRDSVLNTIPIYEYYNLEHNSHIYSDQAINDSRYVNEVIKFYAYKEDDTGLIPIKRFKNPNNTFLYIRINRHEDNNWIDEEIAFYGIDKTRFEQNINILIFDFKTLGQVDEIKIKYFSDKLINEVINTKIFNVIGKNSINNYFKKMDYDQSSCDNSCLDQIGNYFNAKYILNGEIGFIDENTIYGKTELYNNDIGKVSKSIVFDAPDVKKLIRKSLPDVLGTLLGNNVSVPIYRYYHKKNKDHFYTKNPNPKGDWTSEGIEFFAFEEKVYNSIPIYRYYHKKNKDHFYSKNPNPRGDWKHQGIEFYAFENSIQGTIPIYRYYHKKNKDHFYSKHSSASGDWKHQGIEFYAFPTK